jgi:hypothetical protein
MQFCLTYKKQAQEGQTKEKIQKGIQCVGDIKKRETNVMLLKTLDISINYKHSHCYISVKPYLNKGIKLSWIIIARVEWHLETRPSINVTMSSIICW